jgi:integrase/recombinase XerD
MLDLADLDVDDGHARVVGRGGRERLVPLDDGTLNALRTYLSDGRAYLVRNRPGETALVVNQRGQRLTRQGFWLIMKALVKDSGLADSITPHTLRHSFATHQIGEGVALEQLRQRLGHASIATTQIYCQVAGVSPVAELVVDDSTDGRLVLSDR